MCLINAKNQETLILSCRADADRILDLARRVIELLEEAERAQNAAQDAINDALRDITNAQSGLALVIPTCVSPNKLKVFAVQKQWLLVNTKRFILRNKNFVKNIMLFADRLKQKQRQQEKRVKGVCVAWTTFRTDSIPSRRNI